MLIFKRYFTLLLAVGITGVSTAAQTTFQDLFVKLRNEPMPLTSTSFDEAQPILDGLSTESQKEITAELPDILAGTSDPSLAVRRVATLALYTIATRSDGNTLIAGEVLTLKALLLDSDIPIRRGTLLTIYTLWPFMPSPMVPLLRSYLSREDAVETIGSAVAGVLMQNVPNDAESMRAVVQFMHRPDQTAESQADLLNSVGVAKCHNADVAREVARYAETGDEQMSVLAIQTLGNMGKSAVVENQESLVRVAGDITRPQTVRAAAAKMMSAFP